MNASLRNRFVSDGMKAQSNERTLVALYDRLLADLDGATAGIAAKDVAGTHDKLVHAQRILEELQLAIDTTAWPEGSNLAALYQYAHALLVQANLRKDAGPVAECRALLAPLAEAWRAAWAAVQSGSSELALASAVAGGR
jgi:flagellar protein FliS